MTENDDSFIKVCTWIGEGEGCCHPTIFGKAYCEKHHDRIYITMPPEMADYIFEKEIRTTIDNNPKP